VRSAHDLFEKAGAGGGQEGQHFARLGR
jgi:hypothetical protein